MQRAGARQPLLWHCMLRWQLLCLLYWRLLCLNWQREWLMHVHLSDGWGSLCLLRGGLLSLCWLGR